MPAFHSLPTISYFQLKCLWILCQMWKVINLNYKPLTTIQVEVKYLMLHSICFAENWSHSWKFGQLCSSLLGGAGGKAENANVKISFSWATASTSSVPVLLSCSDHHLLKTCIYASPKDPFSQSPHICWAPTKCHPSNSALRIKTWWGSPRSSLPRKSSRLLLCRVAPAVIQTTG